MKAINSYLQESYPNNPHDIVIKNKFYPQGLREIDIYQYYTKNKNKILNWIDNRNVAFRIRINQKTTIIKRKHKGAIYKLTSKNFEEIINGRTNAIYVEHPRNTNYFVIDIDPGKNIKTEDVLITAKFLFGEFGGKYELLKSSERGIHYIGYVNKKQDIDKLRNKIQFFLGEELIKLNKLSRNIEYTIHTKGRKSNNINLDLSSMYKRSLHIAKYSLTKDFLICDDPSKGIQKINT